MAEIEGPGGPPPSIPDDLTIVQFMFDYQHPIRPIRQNDSPWFIEDTVGRKVRIDEIRSRTHGLANALSTRWQIGEDDVICIFGPNDVDYPVVVWLSSSHLDASLMGTDE
ncbi:hypothetical protein AcW1_003839 [Taiwanofungus camphoratus]|nr:hypothetical protein AcW1_003839 [Antrodia cinnamomea]